jgi:hypothetical protein
MIGVGESVTQCDRALVADLSLKEYDERLALPFDPRLSKLGDEIPNDSGLCPFGSKALQSLFYDVP